MSGLLPSVSVQGITDINTNLVNIQRSLSSLFQQIGVVSISVGTITAGDLYGNPGPGTLAPVGVSPTGGISLSAGGNVVVEWNAGTVNTLGSGVTINSGTLNVSAAQWSAGTVTSLGAGITIPGGVLTVASAQWTAGSVSNVSAGLAVAGGTLTAAWQAATVSTLSTGFTLAAGALSVTAPASSQTTTAAPTGTTDTTGKMMGLAAAITPATLGTVMAIVSGTLANATAIADGAKTQIRWGTGTAPVNGAALTGTAVGGIAQYIAATTAETAPFSLNAVISGLTPGTAIWVDISLAAITGGTAAATNVSVSLVEIC